MWGKVKATAVTVPALVTGALIVTAAACVQIARQTQQIMLCQEEILQLQRMQREQVVDFPTTRQAG